MSSYFVDNRTMQAVVASFHGHNNPTQLGRDLFELNRAAMVARYPSIKGTQEERDYKSDRDSFVFDGRGCSTFQEIRDSKSAVSCLWYQCLEGDHPETNELFARLEAQKNIMEARLAEAKKAQRQAISAKLSEFFEKRPPRRLHAKEAAKFFRSNFLKDAFPSVKFGVRSDHNSIRIRWTNGPTVKQVNDAINRLRAEEHEDGLTAEVVTLDGQPIRLNVRYIFTERDETEGFRERSKKALESLLQEDGQAYCDFINRCAISDRENPHRFIELVKTNTAGILATIQTVKFS
jgi:hypothetical protein